MNNGGIVVLLVTLCAALWYVTKGGRQITSIVSQGQVNAANLPIYDSSSETDQYSIPLVPLQNFSDFPIYGPEGM